MANTPKAQLVSVVRLYDADSSDYIELIVNDSAPDGASDPWASAPKGSLHIHGSTTDDYSALYQKVDDGAGSDDEWAAFFIDGDADAKSLTSTLTMGTDNAIYFRDSGQKIYSSAANVGNLTVGAAADVWRIGAAATNYLQVGYTGKLTLAGSAEIDTRDKYVFFDDFDKWGTWVEAETPYIFNSGTDPQAIDPAISAAENGVVVLTTGDDDGTTGVDAAQLCFRVPVQADSGNLVAEWRLHINTAITNVSVYAGFTDITTLEEPFTNTADALTSAATDAVGFLYDTDATTDEWWAVAVDDDSDDAGCATTGTAPTADVYQVFRIEVSSDGATILYYIDDTLELTLSGDAGVDPSTNLYFTVIACGDGTASKSVDLDYLYISHTRS